MSFDVLYVVKSALEIMGCQLRFKKKLDGNEIILTARSMNLQLVLSKV